MNKQTERERRIQSNDLNVEGCSLAAEFNFSLSVSLVCCSVHSFQECSGWKKNLCRDNHRSFSNSFETLTAIMTTTAKNKTKNVINKSSKKASLTSLVRRCPSRITRAGAIRCPNERRSFFAGFAVGFFFRFAPKEIKLMIPPVANENDREWGKPTRLAENKSSLNIGAYLLGFPSLVLDVVNCLVLSMQKKLLLPRSGSMSIGMRRNLAARKSINALTPWISAFKTSFGHFAAMQNSNITNFRFPIHGPRDTKAMHCPLHGALLSLWFFIANQFN